MQMQDTEPAIGDTSSELTLLAEQSSGHMLKTLLLS